MTIQSAIDAALPQLRAEAEARMTSHCTVRRSGASTTVDSIESPGWADVHTDLPCRLGGSERGGAGTRATSVGRTELQMAVRVLHVPATTSGIADGDLVEITSGEHAGLVLEVVEAAGQDQATARRLPVIEAQRPTEWG